MAHARCRLAGGVTTLLTYVALWLLLSPDPGCAFLGLRVNDCAANVKLAAYLYGVIAACLGLLVSMGLRRFVDRRPR